MIGMEYEFFEISNTADLLKYKTLKIPQSGGAKSIDSSWDYRNENTKTLTHCYHPYPAMMIPQVARRLINEYGSADSIILDPFCGSGTVLVEALVRGNPSIGIDINPLALLIAKAKISVVSERSIKLSKNKICEQYQSQEKSPTAPAFPNIAYWFKDDVIRKLSKLKLSIDLKVRNPEKRDFFYVTFSETVREASNTRNGEFKLFRIPAAKLPNFKPDVWKIFSDKVDRNLLGLMKLKRAVKCPTFHPLILSEDTRNRTSLENASVDLIVTSPPYGDSKTTVAYGQFSRLSMQWLGINDVNVDQESLGGRLPKHYSPNVLQSKSFGNVHKLIYEQDHKRAKDVFAFFSDLKKCFVELNRVLKPGGKACFVVGNRTVKGINIPTDSIIMDFSESLGWKHLTTIVRNIPNKRMPSRNSPTNVSGQTGSTMLNEYIVIMSKDV